MHNSTMMGHSTYGLQPADYAEIAITMAISASIGLWFRFSGGKQKTNIEYIMANRNMPIALVSFSLMATYLSSATLMGLPTDTYTYGTQLVFMALGMPIGIVITSYVFTPVYFNGEVSTSYQFIQKRFGTSARIICSFAFGLQAVLFMGIKLYAPSLALSAVTTLSTWTSVITIGVVCTFYCTIGGMKAVLWSDLFQALLMFTCAIAVITKGSIDLGGISTVFRIANEGGRLVIPSLLPDFSLRYDMLNLISHGIFTVCFTFGTCQLQVQRMLSVRNSSDARKAGYGSIPLLVFFYALCSGCGIVIYATFQNCDPLTMKNQPLAAADQLMPYYIMTHLGHIPGLAGLCISGIFAASLSTVSSYIQTLTVVTIEDFLHPYFGRWNIQIFKTTICAQIITCLYGLLAILIAYAVSAMGSVIEISIRLLSLFGGPILGLYSLAVLTKKANEKGSIAGVACSFFLVLWLTFGSPGKIIHGKLPVSIDGCSITNFSNPVLEEFFLPLNISTTTSGNLNLSTEITVKKQKYFKVISHMHITNIGLIVAFVLGYVFSCAFDWILGAPKEVEPQYLSPVRLWFSKTLKKRIRDKKVIYNVDQMEKNEKVISDSRL